MDLVRAAGAGLALPPDNATAAAQVLATASRDATWLQAAGKAAQRLAVEHFSRDSLVEATQQSLERAVMYFPHRAHRGHAR